jgi:molecular chaperone GrpE
MEDIEKEELIEEIKENAEDKWKSQYIRLAADFDNYKKNKAKQDLERDKYIYESLFKSILPVLDDLYLANKHKDIPEGVQLIFDKLIKILTENGLEKLNRLDAKFDDNFDNAVSMTEDPELPGGMNFDVITDAYVYNGKVIRHANVIVNK